MTVHYFTIIADVDKRSKNDGSITLYGSDLNIDDNATNKQAVKRSKNKDYGNLYFVKVRYIVYVYTEVKKMLIGWVIITVSIVCTQARKQ